MGADVTLVLGPVPGPVPRAGALRVVRVSGAQDMDRAVRENLIDTQVFIGAAAVSDYRPAVMLKAKIKERAPAVTLQLVRNPDIIAWVARRTPQRPPIVIGFALETHDLMKNAQEKLQSKGLDWIVANQESNIGRKNGAATLISRWGEKIPLGTMSKQNLARKIWEALLTRPAL